MTKNSDNEIKKILAKDFPALKIRSIKLLGEGWHNQAFEINSGLIFRFCRKGQGKYLQAEKRIFDLVRGKSSLAVPAPFLSGRDYMVYKKIPGKPLLDAKNNFTASDWKKFAKTIGLFMSAVNKIPARQVHKLKIKADRDTLEIWRKDALKDYAEVKQIIPRKYSESIENFLNMPIKKYSYQEMFCHNDLGIEHIIVSPKNTVTGIIDWGDAALADPAFDLGRLYRDLGDKILKMILAHYKISANAKKTLYHRAINCARFSIFEEIKYGLEKHRPEYIKKSLKYLPILFGNVNAKPDLF